MTRPDPDRLAEWSRGTWSGAAPAEVDGFSHDTRAIRPGQGFVAIATPRRDGHAFLADARARGASCALVSRPVDDPLPQLVVGDSLAGLRAAAAGWRASLRMPVVAVTGSVGKTSTKEMLRDCLAPRVHATEANLNNTIGVPLTLLGADDDRHDAAVVEVGMSEPGELALSAEVVRPDIAVVTAVAAVHLEGVGSLEGVAREKVQLIRHLGACGEAFAPAALLAHAPFAALASRIVAVAYGDEPVPAGVRRVAHARLAPSGAGWRLAVEDASLGRVEAELGDLTEGQARNAALAALAARRAGAPAARVAAALARWRPLGGRGSVHRDGPRELHVDCYNSSPSALADAAAAFVRRTRGPRLWVLGGMAELGAASRDLHAAAGRALPLGPGDRVVALGGDADALAAACGGSVARDPAEVAAMIAAWSGPVLVKGSRAHALERALPEPVRRQLGFH